MNMISSTALACFEPALPVSATAQALNNWNKSRRLVIVR